MTVFIHNKNCICNENIQTTQLAALKVKLTENLLCILYQKVDDARLCKKVDDGHTMLIVFKTRF